MASRIGFSARLCARIALSGSLAACGGSGSGGPPSEAVSVSPQSIVLGQSATLTWSASDASQCNGQGAWGGQQPLQGTTSVTPGSIGSAAYTLICTNGNGQTSQTATLTVKPPAPTVNIAVAPATVTTGQIATVSWSSTNATSCKASGAWTNVATNTTPTSGSVQVSQSTPGSYPYTLDCSNSSGSTSQTATLIVTAGPYVSLSIAPLTINVGQSATLTWSTSGATGCTASGAWSTSALGRALSGTLSVTPAAVGTYTYTLSCSNDKGATVQSATLTVTPPLPTVNLTASPYAIILGGDIMLTWSATNATSCAGSWYAGSLPLSGTTLVTPQSTGPLTYTLSCSGPGGTNSQESYESVNPASVFELTPLVANSAGTAAKTVDPELVSPWGIAFGAGSAGFVANDATNTSTQYDGEGVPQPAGSPQVITFASGSGAAPFHPTGMVANPSTDFVIGSGATAKPAQVIYAGAGGRIGGWAPGVTGNAAVIAYTDGGGAVYTGLALANNGAGNYLYAADFHGNKIDIFDAAFRKQASSAAKFSFTDPSLPGGYAPFGIQAISNGSGGAAQLYVTYAQPGGADGAPKSGAGLGVIDLFDTNGALIKQLVAAGGALNAPWGMALAPQDFGTFGQSLLVGNVGDGKINVFDPASGLLQGALGDISAKALTIPGLWGIAFGNDVGSQIHDALFLAASPPGSATGSYARIDLLHATPVLTNLTVREVYCPAFPCTFIPYPRWLITVQVTSKLPVSRVTVFNNGGEIGIAHGGPTSYAFEWAPYGFRRFHGTAHVSVVVTDVDGDQASASTTFNVP